MMMVVHLHHITTMLLAIIWNMLDAAALARLTVADPTSVGQFAVTTGDVRQYRSVCLNGYRSHAKGKGHAKHDCPNPQARQ